MLAPWLMTSAAAEESAAAGWIGQLGIKSSHRSVMSHHPPETWEKAMVTGNGIQGAMAMGRAPEETIVLNHAGLFLPMAAPFPTVSQATILPELRKMIEEGKFQAASDRVFAYGKEEGKNGDTWTDRFVPACSLQVGMPQRGEIKNYLRATDFMTGVTGTRWEDDAGRHVRRLFVSRPDNVVVLSLTGSQGVDCELGLVLHDPQVGGAAPPPGVTAIRETRAEATDAADGGCLALRTEYTRRWPGSLQGCETAVRVIAKGGTTTVAGNRLTVRGATEVLVLLRTTLSRDIGHSQIADNLTALGGLDGDYDRLLARHVAVHGAIMDRCHLELGGSDSDHWLPAPALFAKSNVGGLNAALLEKEFDACRYLVLSSSGPEYPPNLQGIWGATWRPAWSGDYTQNGNLQTVVASNLAANLPEALEGFFHYLEVQRPEYQDNARRLFGARGIHIPHRTSTHGLNNRWVPAYPMTFWTAGAAWNAQFFYDRWLVTGDKEFLLQRALPWMKEAAVFYEDFLYAGPDGKWIFNPSYSPENDAANTRSQAALNATMDLAAAKELLNNLVTVCGQLGIEADNVAKWQDMLAKMPTYPVNSDGAVAEWNTPLLKDNYTHRHASHLYGLYAGLPAEIAADPKLQAAFKVAIEQRMKWRRANGGADMAFGLCQLGWSAASLRDAKAAYETVDWLANQFWFAESMVTSHNARSIFNIDLAGGLPWLVLQMLVQTDPGRIDLLPALPKEWAAGSVTGVLGRKQLELRRLAWRPGEVTLTLCSAIAQRVTIHVDGLQDMTLSAGKAKIEGTNSTDSRTLDLAMGGEVTLLIRRAGAK